MQRKAQVEFIVLVGLLVVIVSVIYFAYQTGVIFPSPVPSAISQEQKMVKDSVENIIRMGADRTIKWLEAQGGYTLPPFNDSVGFTRVLVPYWQKCDDTYIPDLETDITPRLETAVENYVRWSINETIEIYGKDVTFDLSRLSVNANILANQIDISMNLPTTVQNYSIQQPYRVTIPTKFGEIYEFAKNYAEEAARNRYLELFILNSMYFSKTINEGGVMHEELPTVGVLTLCGETIYRTANQLSNALEGIVGYTLTHVLWWQPTITIPTEPKVYGIEDLNGKTYPQLNPLFQLSDDFGIPIQDSIALTNPAPLLTSEVLTTSGLCMGTYYVQYSFTFPVVLRVHDDLTGYDFNIATLVDVNEMMPGDCGEHAPSSVCINTPDPYGGTTECTTAAPGEPTVEEIMGCTDANCAVNVKVLKPNGRAAGGAGVSFGNCVLDKTNSQGETSGMVGCGRDDLNIHYSEPPHYGLYRYRECNITGNDVSGTYTVYKYPDITMNFYEVNLSTCVKESVRNQVLLTFESKGCYNYIDNGDINPDVIEACRSGDINLCPCLGGDQEACAQSMLDAGITVQTSTTLLQPGNYVVMASLSNITAFTIGAFKTSYNIGTADSIISVNVPLAYNASAGINETHALNLTQTMISSCGINPME